MRLKIKEDDAMRLVDVPTIIKPYQRVEIIRKRYEKDEEETIQTREETIYSGILRDWNPMLNDIIDTWVNFVYVGTDDKISIEVK